MNEVGFTRMSDGTREEYQFLEKKFAKVYHGLTDSVLSMLMQLKGDKLGYRIDRFDHSLQTATRAYRDGADDETVVCALLHDIGDILAPENHCELAVAILRPYVSAENLWIVRHHAVFQGYYYYHHVGRDRDARDQWRDHPLYRRTADFCEHWDQVSFDPDYDTLPLDFFEPKVRTLFEAKLFAYGD
jgi:predicted HD phosphohydrolase